MRIFVVLAISLSFGLPALAQNALWGTSGNTSGSGSQGGGMPAGQGYGQGNTFGGSGSGVQGGNSAAAAARRKQRPKTQTRLKRADEARAKMSGASTMQSYDDNVSAKSSQPAQSADNGNIQQAPASSAAPAQATPAPAKPNGVQTY